MVCNVEMSWYRMHIIHWQLKEKHCPKNNIIFYSLYLQITYALCYPYFLQKIMSYDIMENFCKRVIHFLNIVFCLNCYLTQHKRFLHIMYNIDLWLVAYEDTGIEKEIETYVLFSNITVYLSDAPSTLALKEKENIP